MPDTLAAKLAGERLAAFADGVRARRAGQPASTNPFAGMMLRSSQAREWREGWMWENAQRWWDKDKRHG